MTLAIISDTRRMTEAQFAAVQGMLDAALPSGSRTHVAELATDGWGMVENWTSTAAMSVLF